MPNFAANLTHLWAELPYLDRFDAAAEAGFKAVEVLFPYDAPAPETVKALQRNGLEMVLLNAPGPNYTGGARGFAAQPGGRRGLTMTCAGPCDTPKRLGPALFT